MLQLEECRIENEQRVEWERGIQFAHKLGYIRLKIRLINEETSKRDDITFWLKSVGSSMGDGESVMLSSQSLSSDTSSFAFFNSTPITLPLKCLSVNHGLVYRKVKHLLCMNEQSFNNLD